MMKKVALAGAIFGTFSFSHAGGLEQLVETLQENGYITQEQAEQILQAANRENQNNAGNQEIKQIAKWLKGLKIGGVAYLHYDYKISDTNKANDDFNQFKVDRAYFEVRKYFTKSNYFRLTTDIYQASNGSYNVRLKYAYLNWKLNNYLQTEIGLAHRAAIDWLEHHVWLHRYMDKTFIEDSDGAHLIGSADVGIAFKGKVQKLGYLFGIYNGEGYHGAEDDKHFGKSLEGRVNYTLVPGFTVGLHSTYIDNTNSPTHQQADRFIFQPFAVYKNKYFLIAAQYIYNKESNYYETATSKKSFTNYGWAINGDLYLKNWIKLPTTLFARIGYWNFDNDWSKLKNYSTSASDRTEFIIGAEYRFNKYVRVGADWKHVKYQSEVKTLGGADRDYKDTLRLALEVKW